MQKPIHDIILRFSEDGGSNIFYIRVASRTGYETLPSLLEVLKPLLREGVTLTGEVIPTRFTAL